MRLIEICIGWWAVHAKDPETERWVCIGIASLDHTLDFWGSISSSPDDHPERFFKK